MSALKHAIKNGVKTTEIIKPRLKEKKNDKYETMFIF